MPRILAAGVASLTAAALGVAMVPSVSAAAEMTSETKKLLAYHKVDASILKPLDKELAVPKAWIEGAKKEGTMNVRLNLSLRNFAKLAKVFNARYPGIDLQYKRGVGRDRAVKPLIAFKAGTYAADMVAGFTSLINQYEKANALVDLRSMPTWNSIPAEDHDVARGHYQGINAVFWCVSYNTNRVKKSDLPKTWTDLVNSPRWQNGKVGVGNRPQLFLLHLWGTKGEKWGLEYMNDMFTKLRPQLRKEAINGLMKLASVGEFDMAIPSAGYRVKIQADKGAPIAFHCPEPAPKTSTQYGIFTGNPHPNTSMLFGNWLASIEGQLALNYADGSAPVHKDLQEGKFRVYPEATAGKKAAVRTAKMMLEDLPVLYKHWNKAWSESGGPSRGGRKKH